MAARARSWPATRRWLLALAALASLACAPAGAAPADYAIDPAHSRVTFTVTKWGFVDVEGQLPDVRGTIRWDPKAPAASATSWEVRLASIRTGDPKRDASLLEPEYFDAAAFPSATFSSVRATALDARRLSMEGRLTMRGVTRPVTMQVTHAGEHDVPHEGRLVVFETAFTVNRRDFGIVGGRVLGPAISDEVRIRVRAVARRQ